MANDNKIGLEAVFLDEGFQQGIADYNSAISDAVSNTDRAASDLGGFFDRLSDVTSGAWDGISSAVADSVSGIDDTIQDFGSALRDAEQVTEEIASGISSGFDGSADAVVSSFEDISDGIETSMSESEASASDSVDAFAAAFDALVADASSSSEEVQESVAGIGEATEQTRRTVEENSGSISGTWDALSLDSVVSFTAIAAAIAGVTAELYLMADAAMESEDVMVALRFQIEKTGDKTGITEEQVLGLADSLSKVLPIDDEVITQAITMGMRFDGVTKDNVEPLIRAAADLAVATKKDLPSAMRTLSLAITDPDKALRLFKEAQITLTDAQEKQLKTWAKNGDSAKIFGFILDQVNGKVGGLAETMGTTASGKFKIMQTALGNLQEAAGEGLLNAFKETFERITVFANDPRTIKFFTDLGTTIGTMASTVLDSLPSIMTVIENIAATLKNNEAIIVGVLAAITAALVIFAATAVATFIATAEISIPLLLAVVAIGAAAALLFQAWQENWGGIQDKTMAAWHELEPIFNDLVKLVEDNLPAAAALLAQIWENVLLPAIKLVISYFVDFALPNFVAIVKWLAVNIPIAIQTVSDFFNTVLLPAIQVASEWITSTFIPAMTELWNQLQTVIPNALQFLGDAWANVQARIQAVQDWINGVLLPTLNSVVEFLTAPFVAAVTFLSNVWTGVLLPAIQTVWGFMTNYIVPLVMALSDLMRAALGAAIRVLAGLWLRVLLPALQSIWTFISRNVISVFNQISSVINSVVSVALSRLAQIWTGIVLPALSAVWAFIVNNVLPIFNQIVSIIQGALNTALNTLADIWKNTVLPALNAVWSFIQNNFLSILQDLQEEVEEAQTPLQNMSNFLNNTFAGALQGIKDGFQFIIDKIHELTDALDTLTLPDWLTPGSPTPLENGLLGINEQLDRLTKAALPTLRSQLEVLASVRDVRGSSTQSPVNSITNANRITRNNLYGPRFEVRNVTTLTQILDGLQ